MVSRSQKRMKSGETKGEQIREIVLFPSPFGPKRLAVFLGGGIDQMKHGIRC